MSYCDLDVLSRYVDGSLTLPARVDLEVHLRACAACRNELQSMRHLDTVLQSWGSIRVPVPDLAHRRVIRTVERRKRFAPVHTINRIMPAAVGSAVAALLILGSINLGMLYPSSATSATVRPSPALSPALVKQSSRLIRVRRTSAVIGGYAAAPHVEPVQLSRRIQLEVN